ncbi:MAG: hypothetical protein RL038_220 [Actinomycetota bacterium]|jgi:AcrR family transcriptional regulator
MPKIVAESVAANRDLRQNAILSAATEIARAQGFEAVTIGAVAQHAGLARSSVYAYFNSSADLIADVLVDELTDFIDYLSEKTASLPRDKMFIRRWIETSMEYILDGRHSLARAAGSVELPATRRAQLKNLHREMYQPLAETLVSLGAENPMRVGQQISALLDVAVLRIEQGHDSVTETAALFNLLNQAFPELIA